ncbi:MAG: polysaccharide pyruvyl transferase CsaB [Armatimonadota bacterium]
MTSPRFLVSGYYGFGNTGDEAILAGLIEGFRELCSEAELTVLSGNPDGTMTEHGVVAVPRGLGSVRRHLPLCDAFIAGGGGLLQDVTSWRSPLYYLAAMRLARSARRPVAFIAQSIGPLRRSWVRALARKALSQAEVVAVRDAASAAALTELGLSRPAEVTADLAFLLPPPTEAEVSAARAKAGIADLTGPVAAIALRNRPGQERDAKAEAVGRAAVALCQALHLRPLLIPMQPAQDTALAQAIAVSSQAGQAIVSPPLRAREMLALTAGCQLVIAMRLHALILGALSRVPLVAVSYDPKVDGLMEQLALEPAADVARFDEERLAQAVRDAWENRAGISSALADRVPIMRRLALRNVELALALVPPN